MRLFMCELFKLVRDIWHVVVQCSCSVHILLMINMLSVVIRLELDTSGYDGAIHDDSDRKHRKLAANRNLHSDLGCLEFKKNHNRILK